MGQTDNAQDAIAIAPDSGLVVILCGLPASGKTTYAKVLEKRGFVRLSIDEMVWRRIGRDTAELAPKLDEQLRTEMEAVLRDELVELMQERRPVVVDSCFLSRQRRDRYKLLIEQHTCRWELVHLQASASVLRDRLRARNGRTDANSVTVSEEVLQSYAVSFEVPRGEGERVILQE